MPRIENGKVTLCGTLLINEKPSHEHSMVRQSVSPSRAWKKAQPQLG